MDFDWNSILQQVVYPAILGLILIIVSIGLKMLASWLKIKAAQSENELFKQLATNAVGAIEQAAAVAEKAAEAKWSSDKKKADAAALVKAEAEAKGLKVTNEQIDKMIESVLGEKKL